MFVLFPLLIVVQAAPRLRALVLVCLGRRDGEWYKTERTDDDVVSLRPAADRRTAHEAALTA